MEVRFGSIQFVLRFFYLFSFIPLLVRRLVTIFLNKLNLIHVQTFYGCYLLQRMLLSSSCSVRYLPFFS